MAALALLAVAVAGALLADHRHTRARYLLDGATSDEIRAVTGDAVTLRRSGAAWLVDDQPADAGRVASLLAALSAARFERDVEPLPNPPTATLKVDVGRPITLIFHGAAPDGEYVERAGRWGVTAPFDHAPDAARWRAPPRTPRLFAGSAEAVTALELDLPGQSRAFTRRDFHWQSDHAVAVDDRRLHDLVVEWAQLRDVPPSPSPSPWGTLRITTAQGRWSYTLGQRDGKVLACGADCFQLDGLDVLLR